MSAAIVNRDELLAWSQAMFPIIEVLMTDWLSPAQSPLEARMPVNNSD